MSLKVNIKFNNLGSMASQVRTEVSNIVTKGIHDMEAHATAATPVDTGYLSNSKQVEIEDGGLSGRISWGADYAPYVNFGTRKMEAQPFATDAFGKVSPSVIEVLRQLEGRLG